MKKNLVRGIYKLANELDEAGLFDAAARLDKVAELVAAAEEEAKKCIHVTFRPEKSMVACLVTIHEMENPIPMGQPVKFTGKTIKDARAAASSKIQELKKEHGASVVEIFEGGLEP